MRRFFVPLTAALALFVSTRAAAQACNDEHYRWTVKTTLAYQGDPATPATPAAMLAWTPRDLYHPAPGQPDCTARADQELTVYAVTGWVRTWKIEKAPAGDGDWHIELTQARNTKRARCIVVEIPDPQYGALYATARQHFLDLIVNSSVNSKKQVVPAVQMTIIGPAFYDAQHRGAKNSGRKPSGHGHCNSSDGALWEIHPVYEVTQP